MLQESQECLLHKGVIYGSILHRSLFPQGVGGGRGVELRGTLDRAEAERNRNFCPYMLSPESQVKPHCCNCFIHRLHQKKKKKSLLKSCVGFQILCLKFFLLWGVLR